MSDAAHRRDGERIRLVYLADSMADVRMVEGLAERFDLTFVAPASLGARISTWPATGSFRTALLPGGRATFVAHAARWLLAHRDGYDVVLALDNLRGAFAATASALVTRKATLLQGGRQTDLYFRCRPDRGWRFWLGLATVKLLVAWNERRADGIGAVSEDVRRWSRRRNRRIAVIPAWGVDAEVYRPQGARDEARAALGLPRDAVLALYRSRIAPEKDPDQFARAVATLRARGRDVVALYVGGEEDEMRAVADRHGIPLISRAAVHPRKELPLYYRSADVVVQTSRAEGLGLSPLEALACEVPVIVSATGGLVEVAGNGEAAVVVPPGDADALARAVEWVLDHPDEAHAMARRGRAMVLERYTPKHAFDGWAALAQQALRARRGGTG